MKPTREEALNNPTTFINSLPNELFKEGWPQKDNRVYKLYKDSKTMREPQQIATHSNGKTIQFPTRCSCGHLYLEKFSWPEPTEDGVIAFCWCGFCRTRHNIMDKHSDK